MGNTQRNHRGRIVYNLAFGTWTLALRSGVVQSWGKRLIR